MELKKRIEDIEKVIDGSKVRRDTRDGNIVWVYSVPKLLEPIEMNSLSELMDFVKGNGAVLEKITQLQKMSPLEQQKEDEILKIMKERNFHFIAMDNGLYSLRYDKGEYHSPYEIMFLSKGDMINFFKVNDPSWLEKALGVEE
jgi:hypothetical protein